MAGPKADNLYGTFGSVPGENASGGGGEAMHNQASPDAFGAQTAEVIEGAGKQQSDLSLQAAQMATETKANDVIVNQYAPKVAQLRSDFDQLDSADKMQGYDDYVKGLKDTQTQLVGGAKSPLEAELLSNYTMRHISNEIDGARRDATTAFIDHSSDVQAGVIRVNSDDAVRNANDPGRFKQGLDSNDALVQINGLDNKLSSEQIEDQQRLVRGQTVASAITHYTNSGDVATGNTLISKYSSDLTNDQRVQLGELTDSENVRQTSKNNADAISAGQPLPPATGYHAAEVRALIANKAQSAGLDINMALGHLRAESADGTNVGKIGNIGQNVSLPKGASLEDQATAMIKDMKEAGDTATKALGREPSAAENYVAYQQGVGGGAALLKASQENPNASALSVLSPLYKSDSIAKSAITNNGGNLNMTASQFVASIEKYYNQKYNSAKSTFPGGVPASLPSGLQQNQGVLQGLPTPDQAPLPQRTLPDTTEQQQANTAAGNIGGYFNQPTAQSPGDAIMAAHTATSPARQPGASPMQAMEHENDVYPQMLQRAMLITDDRIRKGTMAYLKQQHDVITESANSYKQNLNLQAMRLGADPQFNSLDQITPDMRASLLETNPKMLEYLENKITKNDKSQVEVNPTDPAVMQTRNHLLSLKYNAPNDYMNLDLATFAGKLPSKEIVSNQEEQIKMRNDPEALANQNKEVGSINETVKDLLPSAWRKSKPTDEDAGESEAFKGKLIDEVYKERDANNGKMPNRDEIRKLTTSLLGSYVADGKDVVVDSHSWTGDNTVHPYQIPTGTSPKDIYMDGSNKQLYIPESYKQSFINSQLATGKQPNEADMIKSYKDIIGYKGK